MEGNNRMGQHHEGDHRDEMKNRYTEPISDSPYTQNQEILNQQSRYSKSDKPNTPEAQSRFPESGINRDQRGNAAGTQRPPIPPDDRIREIVSDRLVDEPGLDTRDINVIVRGGTVTLAGSVDSEASRERARDVVEHLPGIVHVETRLQVRPNEDDDDSTDLRSKSKETFS